MAKSRTEIDKDMMYRKIMPSKKASDSPAESSINLAAGQDECINIHNKATAGLQLPEPQNMVLINLMEDLVLTRLDSTLMRFNCCRCNKCKKDIAALTLNKLTPHYVVMKRGDEEKKNAAEEKYSSEVTGALVQAIMLVKKEPRH